MSGVDITPSFWEEINRLNSELADTEHDLVIFTDGLTALEKRLMQMADERFYAENKKRLPECLQRREAKADKRYTALIRNKARVTSKRMLLRGQIKIMEMQFDEWRTREANKRRAY